MIAAAGVSGRAALAPPLLLLAGFGPLSGCAPQPNFPAPLAVRAEEREVSYAFDTDGDGRADFWQYQRPGGRKHAIAYAAGGSARPAERIELDQIAKPSCPHLMIVLDGVPFELVAQLYRQGRFRFFHPPARVICCFPSMSDLALAELFHVGPCLAYEAHYFDRQQNRMSNGNAVYLSAANSPWVARLDYRCSFWWDARAYLDPQAVFDHEIRGILRTFASRKEGQTIAYSVGTAGLGTRGGRAAIVRYLRTIDRLCEQIIYQRRGRVQITLTADHGHNLVENRRVSFRKLLEAGGYRQARSLRVRQAPGTGARRYDPRDVVPVAYGLVTYAAFYCADPAGVAACLVRHPDVEFACYRRNDAVVIQAAAGRALISRGATGFYYRTAGADPLRLEPIIERLRREGKVAADGQIDEAALFQATVDHYYPDPLARVWDAFDRLVRHPPDLIANLRDGACYGSRFFHFLIGKVASTHGSLNRMNSTTFALTTLGELPPVMRSGQVMPALQALRHSKE